MALAIMLFVSHFASAEEPKTGWKLETVAISSGDSPIASGITAMVEVAKGRFLVQSAFQHEQAWVVAGSKIGKVGKAKTDTSFRGFAGAAVGHFQGAPWAGPYLWLKKPITKDVAVSMLQWPAVFAWDPRSRKGEYNPEWARVGYVMVYQLDIGPVGLFYSGLDYLDDPWNNLPGVSLKHKFQKEFTISASATRNTNKREWMFLIGATWEP